MLMFTLKNKVNYTRAEKKSQVRNRIELEISFAKLAENEMAEVWLCCK